MKIGGYFGYLFNARSKNKEVQNTPIMSVIDLNALDLDAIDPSISQLLSSFYLQLVKLIFQKQQVKMVYLQSTLD